MEKNNNDDSILTSSIDSLIHHPKIGCNPSNLKLLASKRQR